jgi:thiol:disulfide interchange protein
MLAGWAIVVLVAILMLVLRGREEAGPAVVFSVVALAVAAWLWRRGTRAAIITSLALGLLWLVQFAAYTVADAMDDDADAGIFITDVIAVIGGVLIVVGAMQALSERRRQHVAA